MKSQIPRFELSILPEYMIKSLTIDDEREIQSFLEECGEYNMMESGRLPQPEAAREFLTDLPPGKELADKYCLAVEKDARIVALMDIVKNYPTRGIWWIGLLLIHPDHQGIGLGTIIVNAILSWFSKEGVQGIRLGVLEENEKGFRFWQKIGFHEIDRKFNRTFGMKTHTVIFMEYSGSEP